ncbi:MAG TPA: hypothetical protein VJ691_09095, partial [Vicinamibacterales bacterium]|nr:hypothetical protein [Vicinamibacterales bacterium]
MRKELESAFWMLRVGFGVAPALAGLDKIFRTNLLADWVAYISPLATAMLPISGDAFMQIVGVIELAVGIAVLTVATRAGAYVAAAWLVAIALNLLTTGQYFDIAVRDLLMAIAAYTLARLAEVRASVPQPERVSLSHAAA